ncbi:MAG: sigma-70 family RNA polymerase sigma factor [Phycisphaeraceae bacterium]
MTSSHEIVSNAYAQSVIRIKAHQLCRRADFSRSDMEDLRQEMWLYLVKVARLFNPDRACLETFIARAIDSCVAIILRDRQREKRRAGLDATSLEGTLAGGAEERGPLSRHLVPTDQSRRTGNVPVDPVERLETVEAVSVAMAKLPPKVRSIAKRLMHASPTAVAKEMGISRRQVRNAIDEMEGVFRDAGLGRD